ncbi:unnamed protein product [Rhizophagus irregularis]|nr:unnamed protein product [Rhizophagus irregularis]
MCICARRMNLYSLERGNQELSINQISHELNHKLLNNYVQCSLGSGLSYEYKYMCLACIYAEILTILLIE